MSDLTEQEVRNVERLMHGLEAVDIEETPEAKRLQDAEQRERLAQRNLTNTLAEMMKVPDIRTVVYRWLAACRAFEPHDFPYGHRMDFGALARNAAHREIAQFILGDLHRACPDLYLTMLRENQNVRNND